MVEISIVIPVFNSESVLPKLNNEISTALEGIEYELILVNDKSRDKSWEQIISICNLNPRVKGINLKKNSGQDNAIMAGLTYATGAYTVIMDDDLQHSPHDILKLHQKCKEGFDVCYGFFDNKKQTVWKNLGSRLNGLVAEIFLKKPKSLYLSPFKIMHSSVVNEVTQYFGPFPYVDGILLSVTSNFAQIPLEHKKRAEGKSNYNFIRSVSVFLKHVTGYSFYPLRIATIMGVFAATLSFILGLFFLGDYYTSDRKVEGWITLVLLLVFFNGLILMCLGLIGEYIGRIYITTTRKPPFVIDKVIGQNSVGR